MIDSSVIATRGAIRGILLAAVLVGASASSALGGPPYPLLGIYPMGPLQSNFSAPPSQLPAGISEINGINAWIAPTGKQINIAGDFMDPEFPNPDFNVPADLGEVFFGGRASGAWVNGYVPFVNLLYYGPYDSGGNVVPPQRTSTDIANGLTDVNTRKWAKEFAKWTNGGQRRAFLAPLPEANFPGPPYAVGTTDDFKQAFRRIRQIFEEELTGLGVPLTAISWVFAPNNASGQGLANFESYYPGSDAVDIVGFSAYNTGGCPGNEPWFIWETFDIAIKPYLDRMRAMAPNKPVFVTQTGTVEVPAHGVGDKNTWLDDTYTKISGYPGVKGVIYYNVIIGSGINCPNGLDFRLYVPGGTQWQGFPTGLGQPGVNYEHYALNDPDLVNVVFGRPQQIFADVLPNHPLLGGDGPPDLSPFIHKLYAAGVTGGCNQSPLSYCPGGTVIRKHMAAFLLRAKHGSGYTPPGATGMFDDVAPGDPFAAFVEALFNEGITTGCGGNNFCPDQAVTRGQMAKFLLKAKFGQNYTPPAATGDFDDVPVGSSLAPYIEELAALGITGGCGTRLYCPNNPVTRAQMAVFLVRTFNL